MSSIDDVKAVAKQVWPNAASIDVHPGAAAVVSFQGPDESGFRVMAIDDVGNIIDQLVAPTLEELRVLLDLRLNES